MEQEPSVSRRIFAIDSLLDNDLYKFSMQQAVLSLYPGVNVTYQYRNRSPQEHRYTKEAYEILTKRIEALADLALTPDERTFLERKCPFFTSKYLDYLSAFRYTPKAHIQMSLSSSGDLEIWIKGLWLDTILYEVPILALVSETYFEFVETDWDMEGQEEQAETDARQLILGGCKFTEFGTRRRRSREVQRAVVESLKKANLELNGSTLGADQLGCNRVAREERGELLGTSNVYFAMKYDLNPIGTVAHEWTMAISVLENDLLHANGNALRIWRRCYPTDFGTALTDTFGTAAFLRDFDAPLAESYTAVRQDSGDPREFVLAIIEQYEKLNIDPAKKLIVFSDGLTVQKALELKSYVKGLRRQRGNGVPDVSFGIGTHFTNNFRVKSDGAKSRPMNIVIKLYECNGRHVVKLSDDTGKFQGDEAAVREALKVFMPDRSTP
ncbi:nicotinate phosphoribosyltransferase [Spizellomyces sp. 'palustris']|nr:nicotinate phosphoribosyltransferase [Spizellomyces sp. 'palustris']